MPFPDNSTGLAPLYRPLKGVLRGGAHALEFGGEASSPSDPSPTERVPHFIDPAKKNQEKLLCPSRSGI